MLPVALARSKWPLGFTRMRRVPAQIWLWGELPVGASVAVVGTRKPSELGVASTQAFVRELVAAGVTVVSGGALGIDTAAHEAAIAAGGKTIVVAPSWLSHPYPRANHALYDRVLAAGGAYLCHVERPQKARLYDFHRRNEILTAYADVLVVAQCGYQSGTKNTVKHARAQGRSVYVLPSAYGDERGLGSNALFNEGAKLVLSAESLLREALGIGAQGAKAAPSDPIVRALLGGAETLEQIVDLSGERPEVVQHRLLLLTLEGAVQEDARGLLRYQARP
jgi:DNA processing protein